MTTLQTCGALESSCKWPSISHCCSSLTHSLTHSPTPPPLCRFELLVGKPPFYTTSIYSLINHIVKDPVKYPPDISPDFRSFLSGLLQKDHTKRLTWPHLLDHPFVRETAAEREERALATSQGRQVCGGTPTPTTTITTTNTWSTPPPPPTDVATLPYGVVHQGPGAQRARSTAHCWLACHHSRRGAKAGT